MRFVPKSEAEVSAGSLLSPGIYDFEIVKATETTSKASGNDMIALEVKVYDTDGRGQTVFDYLVGTEKAQYKVRHCAASVGLLDHYETGELDAEILIGRAGRCKVVMKKGNGQYADQNAIADYIAVEATNGAAKAAGFGMPPSHRTGNLKDDLNDDIPFAPER